MLNPLSILQSWTVNVHSIIFVWSAFWEFCVELCQELIWSSKAIIKHTLHEFIPCNFQHGIRKAVHLIFGKVCKLLGNSNPQEGKTWLETSVWTRFLWRSWCMRCGPSCRGLQNKMMNLLYNSSLNHKHHRSLKALSHWSWS